MGIEERLKQLVCEATDRGIAQIEIARRIGVSRATISNWKVGRVKELYPKSLVNAARFFGVNVEWIVFGEGPRERPSYSPSGADMNLLQETVTTVLSVLAERHIKLSPDKTGKLIVAAYEDAIEESSPPRQARVVRLVKLSE